MISEIVAVTDLVMPCCYCDTTVGIRGYKAICATAVSGQIPLEWPAGCNSTAPWSDHEGVVTGGRLYAGKFVICYLLTSRHAVEKRHFAFVVTFRLPAHNSCSYCSIVICCFIIRSTMVDINIDRHFSAYTYIIGILCSGSELFQHGSLTRCTPYMHGWRIVKTPGGAFRLVAVQFIA